MGLETITLAKALKLKNRIAGRISKLNQNIQEYNSVPEGKETLDVHALLTDRDHLVKQLVGLKVVINAVNNPIQRDIYELAELKSKIDLLTKMSTAHGKVVEGYTGATVNYTARIRKGAVDAMSRTLEKEIDRLQDRLDTFNHETKVSVDSDLLADEADRPSG